MTTRATMSTEIQGDFERTDTAFVTAVANKIDVAIRNYETVRFWFNETDTVTFNTVASTDFYTFATIGTAFYEIDAVFVTVAAGDERELTKNRWVELRADAGGTTGTGIPTDFAYDNRGLRFYPNPGAIYSMRIIGHYKLAGPTDDVTANDWMTYAYDLIMNRAKVELYDNYLQDTSGNSARPAAAEMRALRSLKDATHDKTATNTITASDF